MPGVPSKRKSCSKLIGLPQSPISPCKFAKINDVTRGKQQGILYNSPSSTPKRPMRVVDPAFSSPTGKLTLNECYPTSMNDSPCRTPKKQIRSQVPQTTPSKRRTIMPRFIDLTPSRGANTPSSRRLILEEFFKKTKSGKPTTKNEEKKLEKILKDPLSQIMANYMNSRACTLEEGKLKEKNVSGCLQPLPEGKWTTSSSYFRAANLVHTSYIPEKMIGRKEEKRLLENFWDSHISAGKPGSLCITGCPGSGKTALLDNIIKDRLKNPRPGDAPLNLFKVNCMTILDPSRVLTGLLSGICKDAPQDKSERELLRRILIPNTKKKVSPIYLIVMDEIDRIVDRVQDTIYQIFEWTTEANSRLVFIGIANTLNFIDRFLPLLKSINYTPQVLNFKPYTVEEIKDVIMNRLSGGEGYSNTKPLVEPNAIEAIARKIAGTGDLRKALNICRDAIRFAHLEDTKKDAPVGSLPKITTEHVMLAIRNTNKLNSNNTIRGLNMNQKSVLCVLALQEKVDLTLGQLYEAYRIAMLNTNVGLSLMAKGEFSDVITYLSALNLISVDENVKTRHGGAWSLRHVAQNFKTEDLIVAIRDVKPLESLLTSLTGSNVK